MALVSAEENAARLRPFEQPLAQRSAGGYTWNQPPPGGPSGVPMGPQSGPVTAMQARPLPGMDMEMPMSQRRPPGSAPVAPQGPAAQQLMGRRRAISDLMRRRPVMY